MCANLVHVFNVLLINIYNLISGFVHCLISLLIFSYFNLLEAVVCYNKYCFVHCIV